MADNVGGPWWVVIAAGVPSAISGLWVGWRWWVERTDKRDEVGTTREQRAQDELDRRAARLTAEDAALFARQTAELVRLLKRCADLEADRDRIEADRDRGWDLARYWNRRSHELRHAGLNAQTMVMGLIERDPSLPRPTWPDMGLVGFEEPFPPPAAE